MENSAYQMKVDALSKASSTLTIRGKVFDEADDTVTALVGNSLFEIPRESILSMTNVEGAEAKTVDMSIDRGAKIIQKTLTTPELAVGAITSSVFSGDDIPQCGNNPLVIWPRHYCWCYCVPIDLNQQANQQVFRTQ